MSPVQLLSCLATATYEIFDILAVSQGVSGDVLWLALLRCGCRKVRVGAAWRLGGERKITKRREVRGLGVGAYRPMGARKRPRLKTNQVFAKGTKDNVCEIQSD